jgi:hypothetical protein
MNRLIRWFRQTARYMGVGVAPAISASLLLQLPARAYPAPLVAVDPGDLPCYMQTADGRIINLSKFCGGRNRTAPIVLTVDQAFVEQYQNILRNRWGRSPQAQTALAQAQQNPQAIIQRAQSACALIRIGGSEAALFSPGQIDAKVINDLALNYYCPDLSN